MFVATTHSPAPVQSRTSPAIPPDLTCLLYPDGVIKQQPAFSTAPGPASASCHVRAGSSEQNRASIPELSSASVSNRLP